MARVTKMEKVTKINLKNIRESLYVFGDGVRRGDRIEFQAIPYFQPKDPSLETISLVYEKLSPIREVDGGRVLDYTGDNILSRREIESYFF